VKTRKKNKETVNQPWTPLPKGRRRWFVCFQKTNTAGANELRRSLRGGTYVTVGICARQEDPLVQTLRVH